MNRNVTKLPPFSTSERQRLIKQIDCEDFFYVQVGAFDGLKFDNFSADINSQKHWKGLLVEPHPAAFKQLQGKRGSNPNIVLDNSAVTPKTALYDFYLKETCSSLSQNKNILSASKPVKKITVNGLTWGDLLLKHSINRVHLAHIDAEGYDCKIVNQILKSKLPLPYIIEFECNDLTDDDEVAQTFKQLELRNYKLGFMQWDYANFDCIAYLKNQNDSI